MGREEEVEKMREYGRYEALSTNYRRELFSAPDLWVLLAAIVHEPRVFFLVAYALIKSSKIYHFISLFIA